MLSLPKDLSPAGADRMALTAARIAVPPPATSRLPTTADRRAVADLLALLDTGQSVPQRQQPLPLSWAACNSAFDATTVSPSLTTAGGSPHSVIPSLPII